MLAFSIYEINPRVGKHSPITDVKLNKILTFFDDLENVRIKQDITMTGNVQLFQLRREFGTEKWFWTGFNTKVYVALLLWVVKSVLLQLSKYKENFWRQVLPIKKIGKVQISYKYIDRVCKITIQIPRYRIPDTS